MANNRDRMDRERYGRDQERQGRQQQSSRQQQDRNRDYDRDYNRDYENYRDREQYSRGQQDDDWARQVPWTRSRGPYRDYGWERDESSLPEFRDPDVHIQPYERERVSRFYDVDWNEEYDYGTMEERGPRGRREEQGPYSGIGPRNYQRSDERIMEDVCERLTRHGMIDASQINVEVKNGEVMLTGAVDNRQTRRRVEDVIDRVHGVKDIHNQLKIQQERQQGGRYTSGMPGGGAGRIDEVGGSGVYPASGPLPQGNAPVQGEASWGQGDRGAAGYQDSGSSEINMPQEKGKKGQQKQS